MTSGIRTIIFDLDGTLIDSAPDILAGFAFALEAAGVAPKRALDNTLIGPPLLQTLSLLSGLEERSALEAMAREFKRYYDGEGSLASRPYPGAQAALQALAGRGVALHLATNKRRVPTLGILEQLGWSGLFASVYTLDQPGRAFADKAAMLAAQIDDRAIDVGRAAYVGDRAEDREAAEANRLDFIAANWGYGEFAAGPAVAASPSDLLALIQGRG